MRASQASSKERKSVSFANTTYPNTPTNEKASSSHIYATPKDKGMSRMKTQGCEEVPMTEMKKMRLSDLWKIRGNSAVSVPNE